MVLLVEYTSMSFILSLSNQSMQSISTFLLYTYEDKCFLKCDVVGYTNFRGVYANERNRIG